MELNRDRASDRTASCAPGRQRERVHGASPAGKASPEEGFRKASRASAGAAATPPGVPLVLSGPSPASTQALTTPLRSRGHVPLCPLVGQSASVCHMSRRGPCPQLHPDSKESSYFFPVKLCFVCHVKA